MGTQTEADLLALAERVEAAELGTERTRDLRPEAVGAVISISQRQAMIEAREKITGQRRIPNWRQLVDGIGLSAEQVHDRLNTMVARGESKHYGRRAIVAARLLDWYTSELQPLEFAEARGIQYSAFQANLSGYVFGLLNPDLELSDTDVDYLDPEWIAANTSHYSTRTRSAARHRGTSGTVRKSPDDLPTDRYKPSVPDDWFSKPVDLGVPGVRVIPRNDEDNPLAWQVDALCAQTDPEAFFPEKGGSTRDAKRICASCDVKAQCLDYALQNDERFGIWGGLSERERRRLRRAPRSA